MMCISVTAQVQNPGFETWVPNNETSQTYQTPQNWVTSDILITMLNELFGNPGYVVNSVSQTAGHSGNYAVQMNVATSNAGDDVAGLIFYGDSVSTVIGSNPGMPFVTRPANITGWYKWNNVGSDSAGIYLIMTKWNTTTQSRDTIAEKEQYITASAAAWTQFTFPITYSLGMYPDTIFMAFGNASSVPNIGSVFTLDDVAFTGSVPIGVNDLSAGQVAVTAMPNPFTQQATLKIEDAQLSNGTFEMYNMLGNKVRVISNISGSSFIIDREGLSSGMYFYTLTGDDGFVATGKLSVE